MNDEPFIDLVNVVVGCLERAGIEYAVTGSTVSGIYGEPIATYDVDFIVRMNPAQARMLAASLPPRFYRSESAIENAATTFGMANLIDTHTGLKVDLSCIRPSTYRDSVFSRRVKARFTPQAPEFNAVSAEDIILMKLDWRRESQSAKQWNDALSVARTQGTGLDWTYLFKQARQLSLEPDLTRLRDEAGV